MTLKAVLFDLDNTLLDRNTAFRAYAGQLVRTYAAYQDEEQAQQWTSWLIAADRQGYAPKKQLYAEMLQVIPMRDPHTTVETLLKTWLETFSRHTVIMDGAVETLRRLRARGVKLGLITNGGSRSQQAKIDQAGFRPLFDAILVSDEVSIKKPDPAIFVLAITKLGVLPHHAVYVGDHPTNDVDAAVRAGLQAVWLRGKTPGEPKETGRYRTVDHLNKLEDALFHPYAAW
ncbi:HAD family hydrolase [Paenibacillus xanthanilyticus]|uniref:HAD family hydrolase n=1 Tax=Paenibacillus xanthanilyticus TaxID=1783531 RepID=A0ABV8K6Z2_9BACL